MFIYLFTGERPFACDHKNCGKQFTRNEELTRHKRIHTGVRPHPCILCGKRFGRKDHLKKHVKTHQRTNVVRMPVSAFQGLSYFVSDCIPWYWIALSGCYEKFHGWTCRVREFMFNMVFCCPPSPRTLLFREWLHSMVLNYTLWLLQVSWLLNILNRVREFMLNMVFCCLPSPRTILLCEGLHSMEQNYTFWLLWEISRLNILNRVFKR